MTIEVAKARTSRWSPSYVQRRSAVLRQHYAESKAEGARAGQQYREGATPAVACALDELAEGSARVSWARLRAVLADGDEGALAEIEEALEAEMFFKDAFAVGFVAGAHRAGKETVDG